MPSQCKGEATKKKVKKSKLRIYETVYGEITPSAVQRATENESQRALQDRTMEEIKETRRALESYLNDMKIKLEHSTLLKFATDADREAFRAKLIETEDWLEQKFLFGDNDTDEFKRACTDKLEELKKMVPENLKTIPREGGPKFLPNKSKAIIDSERKSGYKNLKLFLHGQGECISSNPSICQEDPSSEKVDVYQSQELLVREVIAYKKNAGKYPTLGRRLRLLIDEYSKIHKRVKEGKRVELFRKQFNVYKMVLHFLEDGILLNPDSDSNSEE
ncbi:hypothetical protein OSB04_030134 [Centaurea solstitialis]|uniref:Uncharacterized protein n=1 Tax=Centaurea solstitialis TaxID=347529 RepID=A0AA38SJ94_9ASTR|nr:hypothetical protein OSB04_030134 [Centaurea solstitialis]